MSNVAWQNKKSLRVIDLLLKSYKNSYGKHLILPSNNFSTQENHAFELYNLQNPVMAHNNAQEPCLSYANSAALELWKMSWSEMIGMPSSITTPKNEQSERSKALSQATKNHAIENYQGIRVNSQGELFMINNVRIWTMLDEEGHIFGQAATFNSWWKI